MYSIGERIKQRRKELGLTQGELAERMGYKSKSAICKVETVEDNITTDRIMDFAKALECSPAYLMGWKDVDFVVEDEDLEFVVEAYRHSDDSTKEMVKRLLTYNDLIKGEKQ